MTEPPRDDAADGPSAGTKDWVARRTAARRAALADRLRADAERAVRDEETKRDYGNPRGVWIGLAVIVVLLLGALFIIKQMSCDPFYADRALTRNGACG